MTTTSQPLHTNFYGALPEPTPLTVRFGAALIGATILGGDLWRRSLATIFGDDLWRRSLATAVEVGLLRPLYARPIYQIVLIFPQGIVGTVHRWWRR